MKSRGTTQTGISSQDRWMLEKHLTIRPIIKIAQQMSKIEGKDSKQKQGRAYQILLG